MQWTMSVLDKQVSAQSMPPGSAQHVHVTKIMHNVIFSLCSPSLQALSISLK